MNIWISMCYVTEETAQSITIIVTIIIIIIIVITNRTPTTIQESLSCKWHMLLYALIKIYRPFYSNRWSTLRYRHQTITRNPAHQSVACATTYFRMSIQMEEEGSC